MDDYRSNISEYGEPVQQSMGFSPKDYRDLSLHKLMLGVVLEVNASDARHNRTATQTRDRRGFAHDATVLIINGGASDYLLLKNVIITPDSCAGLDNYSEQLPRPASATTEGGVTLNTNFQHIDPYELDGDWCVVGFIGSSLDQPFILRWWPHARNTYDAATSGLGNPDSSGSGTALDQAGRFFRRTNGVEQVITKDGDVYLSTAYSGSSLNVGGSSSNGRFPRNIRDDVGGSVKVNIKPTQGLELDWNTQQNGLGYRGRAVPELPQTNPRGTIENENDKTFTYFRIEQDIVYLSTSDQFDIISANANVTASQTLTLTANDLTETIANAVTLTAASMNTTATGSISFVAGTSFGVGASSISLTSTGSGGDSVQLADANWTSALGNAAAAVAAVTVALTPPLTDAKLAAAITALAGLVAGIGGASNPSTNVKVS